MPEKNYGTLKQPKPKPNDGPDCWHLVMADMGDDTQVMPSATRVLVLEDMSGRHAHGLKEYGTPLQPFNGQDALANPYQEALDLAVYLRAVIEEGGTWAQSSYRTALVLVLELREQIMVRDCMETAHV